MSDTDWMIGAMCYGQPTRWWFPERGDKGMDAYNFKVAKKICKTCGVKKQCLEYGNATQSTGVWGGVILRGRFQSYATNTKLDLQNM